MKNIKYLNRNKEVLDATGLKCPEPILKIVLKTADMKPGDILEVTGDCPTFESDVRKYCERLKKPLLYVSRNVEGIIKCQIQY